MTPQPITYADLAELYDVTNPAGAETMRKGAKEFDGESRASDEGAALDRVFTVLPQVPESKLKHTETCWKTHARCLAAKLSDTIGADYE